MAGEFDLIDKYFKPLSGEGSFGLNDDVALISTPGSVVTKDLLVSGIHFLPDDPPRLVARKALRANISDIVAKGARPVNYLLGCIFNKYTDEKWIAAFAKGLSEDGHEFDLQLLGGDTTRHKGDEPVSISVTMFGAPLDGNTPVKRSQAQVGDSIFVSGTIGDAGLGLMIHNGSLSIGSTEDTFLRDRYLCPQPRAQLAPIIARYASASMDISDGLLADASHLAQASQVQIELYANSIPVSAAAGSWIVQQADKENAMSSLAAAGDDYEILCAVPEKSVQAFQQEVEQVGIRVNKIGRCQPGQGKPVLWLNAEGREILVEKLGFDHFSAH